MCKENNPLNIFKINDNCFDISSIEELITQIIIMELHSTNKVALIK